MASYTIAEMLTSIMAGLVYYVYVYPSLYNSLVTSLASTGIVIPMLEFNWYTVLFWGICSLPLLLIIGCVIYAYDQIAYKTGWGA